MARLDMTGQRYGRLVALEAVGPGANGIQWRFRCDCGNQHQAAGYHVRKGRVVSCGCYRDENVKAPGGRRINGYAKTPLEVRLWWHIEQANFDDCWEWTGAQNKRGYGNVNTGRRKEEAGRTEPAYRASWRILRGEIPAGLALDHLCRNPSCVNPWHLDPVTPQENLRRARPFRAKRATSEACANNHPWTDDTLYVAPSGRRACRECKRIGERKGVA